MCKVEKSFGFFPQRIIAKNLFLSTVIVLSSLLTAQKAQSQAALLVLIFGDKVASEKFHLSIDGGLNFARMEGVGDSEAMAGLHFGLGTFTKLNERWVINAEFKPVSLRNQTDVIPINPIADFIPGARTDIRTNYIDIPVLARYYYAKRFYAAAGAQISFLTMAEQETTGLLPSGAEATVIKSEKSSFSNVHFAIPFELGWVVQDTQNGQGIDLRIRYAQGVSDIFAKDYGEGRGGLLQVLLTFPFVKTAEQ